MEELKMFLQEWEEKTFEYFKGSIKKGEAITDKYERITYWNNNSLAYKFKIEHYSDEEIKENIRKESLIKEKNLIKKVESKVGSIKDARALSVGKDGNLNGIIEGETGKVKLITIYVSGEIQRPHFRTLIKAI